MQWVNRFLDRLESRLALLAYFGISSMTAIITGYFASTADVINQLGPSGWILVGLVALVCCLLAGLIYVETRHRYRRNRALEKWMEPSQAINPMDRQFQNLRINLHDLADPVTNKIEGKTFTDCHLDGPAVYVTAGVQSHYHHPTFMNCDFIVLREDRSVPIRNAIIVDGCVFTRCRISRCVVLMTPGALLPLVSGGVIPISIPTEEILNAEPEKIPQKGQD